MARPRLLYLTPVVPAFTGNGLAMRAAAVLRGLAAHYAVSLRVHALYTAPTTDVPPEVAALCTETIVLPVDAPAPPEEPAFDGVHVFRLATLQFARGPLGQALRRGAARHLDLDDVESVARRRVAGLYRAYGEVALAEGEEQQAAHIQALEDWALRFFHRVYVCSAADRESPLARGATAEVRVLPNTVRLASAPLPRREGEPFRFLFVGTLGYYPNEDAVRFFCIQVLPLLRAAARRPFRVEVVGTGASPAVRQLECLPEVRVVGAVPDVAPYYAAADAVIVPIRAGGGTRIKLLEAFAHRRPVVSTTLGVEGIDARAGEHLLVGDTPEAFAAHCARLMEDGVLAGRLVERAFALVRDRYTPDALAPALAPAASPRGGAGR